MRVFQFILFLILVVQQSYQKLPTIDDSKEVDESFRLPTRRPSADDEWTKDPKLEDVFYNPGPEWKKEQDDLKRSVSVRSAAMTDYDDKKRSVSVRSKAYGEDDDYPQWEKKRSVSVRSPTYNVVYSMYKKLAGANDRDNYEQEQYDDNMRGTNYGPRAYYGNEQEERNQQYQDDQDEYSHIKIRSLFPGIGSNANDEQQNSPLKQLVEKLQNRQSVPVTLREIHQIVRESQKQIWDQVVKMIPGGQLAQAMARAQKEKLFAGLAFNPFQRYIKNTKTDNGLPGPNTIFPRPEPGFPGPLGQLFNAVQSKTNTESKQGGFFNHLSAFESSN